MAGQHFTLLLTIAQKSKLNMRKGLRLNQIENRGYIQKTQRTQKRKHQKTFKNSKWGVTNSFRKHKEHKKESTRKPSKTANGGHQ